MTRAGVLLAIAMVCRVVHAQPSPAGEPDATAPKPPVTADPPPVPANGPRVPADVPVQPPIQTAPLPPVAPQPLPPPPPTPPAQESPSTSATWSPSYHFDWHWRLLMLPERVVQLAFIPAELLVGAIERHALDERFADFVTFYDGRIKLSPRFKFSFGDGTGAGVWFKRTGLFDGHATSRLGGVYRLNGDYQLELEYDHEYLFPGGRGLRLRSYVEDDKNQRYYGLGNATLLDDRRVIRSQHVGALAEMDLQGVDRYTYSGVLQLGIRAQHLSPGTATTIPSLMEGDTTTPPPPGFDETAVFTDLRLVGRYDTRDTAGRPTRGIYAEASALARTDVTGKSLSAVTLTANARIHLPIAPDKRVLLLTIGGAAALHLFPGDEIPLESYAYLGRTNLLRGFDRERFRDRYMVQASAEYRFPIYEYLSSRAGLDAFGFFDAGSTWGVNAFSLSPIRYSYGGGLRAAHETTLVFELTLGFSAETYELNLGVEKAL